MKKLNWNGIHIDVLLVQYSHSGSNLLLAVAMVSLSPAPQTSRTLPSLRPFCSHSLCSLSKTYHNLYFLIWMFASSGKVVISKIRPLDYIHTHARYDIIGIICECWPEDVEARERENGKRNVPKEKWKMEGESIWRESEWNHYTATFSRLPKCLYTHTQIVNAQL